MNILLAFDKFKDSMTATLACQSAEIGLRGALEGSAANLNIEYAPLTDGGEGFCRILSETASGEIDYHVVTGPLGEEIDAPLGWVEASNLNSATREILGDISGKIAVIEMAAVAGLEQVPFDQRHPNQTTTFGVGQLLEIAAKEADAILLGIGGSATSDLGLGALEALGLRFDPVEKIVPSQWPKVSEISGILPVELPPIYIACDVDNPLTGPTGAAVVYGPQKGLKPHEIEPFDKQAEHLAKKLCAFFNQPDSLLETPSCGAAGGIGFGLKAAYGAQFVPGFELVHAWLDLAAKIEKADVLFTGEGKFDESSLAGKGPYALLDAAGKSSKRSILLAGVLTEGVKSELFQRYGEQVFAQAITPKNMPLQDALARGPENLELAAQSATRETIGSAK